MSIAGARVLIETDSGGASNWDLADTGGREVEEPPGTWLTRLGDFELPVVIEHAVVEQLVVTLRGPELQRWRGHGRRHVVPADRSNASAGAPAADGELVFSREPLPFDRLRSGRLDLNLKVDRLRLHELQVGVLSGKVRPTDIPAVGLTVDIDASGASHHELAASASGQADHCAKALAEVGRLPADRD